MDSYRFESPLVGVIKAPGGIYEGWYAPSQPGTWTIRIGFPGGTVREVKSAKINGEAAKVSIGSDRTAVLRGGSEAGRPFRWRIQV